MEVGDPAPDFIAPVATDDGIESFSLADRLDEAPLVLAFFPGAFTGTCTAEMTTFRDRVEEFADAGATVYGISVDSPWSLGEFRSKHDLPFALVSDFERRAIDAYGVGTRFEGVGVVAQRAVFVIDADCRIAYRWVADDASKEPDYDRVLEAARAA